MRLGSEMPPPSPVRIIQEAYRDGASPSGDVALCVDETLDDILLFPIDSNEKEIEIVMPPQIHVAVDVGCRQHRVAIGCSDGKLLDEFDITHDSTGFHTFFRHIAEHERRLSLPVVVAMEGFNGWARPLDTQVRRRGHRLYNVNNVKLARFKEIFPAPAKTDAIDTRKMWELLALRHHVPVAKEVLQEIAPTAPENEKLKRLTRRRRQLVNEKVRIVNRLHADLQAVSPGLLAITRQVDNLWFLRFITCRDALPKLARRHRQSLVKIPGIGKKYASVIAHWQARAHFSPDVAWAGEMIIEDANRVLALLSGIAALNTSIAELAQHSALATRIASIPGFGDTCSAELAGEIGTLERFNAETGLAIYLGMAPLDNRSGKYQGTKKPRQVNTRAKAAMMTAVARHIAHAPQSKAYYDRKRVAGKKHNQAIRATGRRLVRVMWAMMKQDRDYEIRK